MSGSAIALTGRTTRNAILHAWYRARRAARRLAQTLDGKQQPLGPAPGHRLHGLDQLPSSTGLTRVARARTGTSTASRCFPSGTGWLLDVRLLRPAGAGDVEAGQPLPVEAQCREHGSLRGRRGRPGLPDVPEAAGAPLRALRGFTRVHLAPGERQTVRFTLNDRDLSHVSSRRRAPRARRRYGYQRRGGQPAPGPVVTGTFEITGSARCRGDRLVAIDSPGVRGLPHLESVHRQARGRTVIRRAPRERACAMVRRGP